LAGGQGFGEVLRGPENYVLRFSALIAYWLILQELWQTLNICITHFATMSYSNSEHYTPCSAYPPLRHGETGKGLNDYDAIFRLLAEAGFGGWISIEDGMNGLDELQRSAVLKQRRARY
jgi:hypothetical protein